MKVKELIKKLECYNPDSEIGFTLNPTTDEMGEDGNFDVNLEPNVIGNLECPEFLFTLNKSKFDSISEILTTVEDEVNISMTNKGLFVFKDGILVREIEVNDDFYDDESFLNDYPNAYIRMLLRIL